LHGAKLGAMEVGWLWTHGREEIQNI